jgi:tRNA (guanine26-N2/guanine27-N2)-dimethyltransferase
MVQFEGKEYFVVKEGLAYILKPISQQEPNDVHDPPSKKQKQPNNQNQNETVKDENDHDPQDSSQSVFYNPIQQFNRDLSVLAIRAFGESLLEERRQNADVLRKRWAKKRELKAQKRKRDHGNKAETVKNSTAVNENSDTRETQDIPEHVVNPPQSQTDLESGSAAASGLAEISSAGSTDPKQEVSNLVQASFTILDALSATGLRAFRYAKEIPFASRIVANDLSPAAVSSIRLNVAYNGVEALVQPNQDDARSFLYKTLALKSSHRFQGRRNGMGEKNQITKFDVIDLDPYGTAAPFFDAAVQSVSNGGLLCVTCTDAGVFASTGYLEKTWALYGGAPMKGSNCHEAGLRLILNGIATSAARYGLAIEPLLSLSIDYYARVFVRIYESPLQVKFASGNTMLVYNCDSGCGAWKTQPITATRIKQNKKGEPFYHYAPAQGPTALPQCSHCGFKTHLAGPMWAGPLHNRHFIQKILDMLPKLNRDIYRTAERIEGMLKTALEEDLDFVSSTKNGNNVVDLTTLQAMDVTSRIIPRTDPAVCDPYPFFVSITALAKVVHAPTPPLNAFRGALSGLGYRFTRSHTSPNSLRTDAPWDVIWEIMREWIRQKCPLKEGTLSAGSAGAVVMRKARDPAILSGIENGKPPDERLVALQEATKSALENSKSVRELMIQLEAALYRSGSHHVAEKVTCGMGATSMTSNSTTSASLTTTPPLPLSQLEISFDEELGDRVNAAQSDKRVVRYQMNPRANWGPMTKAR